MRLNKQISTTAKQIKLKHSRTKKYPPYMFPGDSFSLILFLLLLQHQLDEELLQLLVTVVDAELFKATKRANVTDSHTGNNQHKDAGVVVFCFCCCCAFIQTCCSGRSQNHRCPAPRWPCSSRGLWRRSSSPRWCHWSVPQSSRTDARTWPEDDTDTFIRIRIGACGRWLAAGTEQSSTQTMNSHRCDRYEWKCHNISESDVLFAAHSAGLKCAHMHCFLHSLQPLSGVITLWLTLLWISVNRCENIV